MQFLYEHLQINALNHWIEINVCMATVHKYFKYYSKSFSHVTSDY